MRRRIIMLGMIGVVAALGMSQTDCNIEFPKPPFDTTGTYIGTWSGVSDDTAQTVAACPLTINLNQDLTLAYPGDHAVTGTVTIDYSCIELPDWVDEPLPTTVPVAGILKDDGTLGLMTGGCDVAICVVLGLAGQGYDDEGDGVMDAYEGNWTYAILLAGVQPFGFGGVFSVERE